MSLRSQRAKSGRTPIAACSTACRPPARSACSPGHPPEAGGREVEPESRCAKHLSGQVQRHVPEVGLLGVGPVEAPLAVPHDLARDLHFAAFQPGAEQTAARLRLDDADVGQLSGLGVVRNVRGAEVGNSGLDVHTFDQVGLALVQVDRAGVQLTERAPPRRRARGRGRTPTRPRGTPTARSNGC